MKPSYLVLSLGVAGGLAACGGDDDGAFATNSCDDVTTGTCTQIEAGDETGLQNAANAAEANTTVILGKGLFRLDNALTIRTDGFHLIGQGIEETTLDFGPATAQVNGVDA